MREIIFRGMRDFNGKWVYFDRDGMYVNKDGSAVEPKRFTRDFSYKIVPDTIEAVILEV